MKRGMNEKSRTVCFTGHRDIRENDKVEEKLRIIIEKMIERGYRNFVAGGAQGFDTIAAEIVLELKEKYPTIQLQLNLPFKEQYKHEKNGQMRIFNDLNIFIQKHLI